MDCDPPLLQCCPRRLEVLEQPATGSKKTAGERLAVCNSQFVEPAIAKHGLQCPCVDARPDVEIATELCIWVKGDRWTSREFKIGSRLDNEQLPSDTGGSLQR